MGVSDNDTKYGQEHKGGGRERTASAGPPFQNLQFSAKISLFFFAQNRQMKRNSG